jgi:hypothetical protein
VQRRRAVVLAAVALVGPALAGCGDEDEGALQPELPAALAAACASVAGEASVPVLCPPAGEAGDDGLAVVHEDLDPGPCAYVLNLQQLDHDAAGRDASHVVLGGSCDPLPLTAPGPRWPVDPLKSLRAVATPPLQSGQTPDQVTLRRPVVLRTVTVRGQPGRVLHFDPRPPGGLHGGHYGLAWNEAGHGYLLSLHYETADERRRPRSDEVAALTDFAATLRPAPTSAASPSS